ncbi:MAG: FCD domain-containing protein [Chloroflexota bacterium]|nr:FCD domain-containing protein [Chloroflexota bacterium]
MALSLKEKAYDHILAKMLVGEIRPGARLSDVHLAREIGISRTPVREAIVQMETQGLVEQVEGVGPRAKNLERSDLEETFELREMLEVAAVAKAVTRITEPELRELEAICDQYLAAARGLRKPDKAESEQLFHRLVVMDMAFHLMVMRAARNRRLLRIMGDLHLLSRIFRRRAELPGVNALTRAALDWRDHVRIVGSLRRRDLTAAQACMGRHIERARKYHLDAFDWHRRQLAVGAVADADLPPHLSRMLSGMELGELASVPSPPTPKQRRRRAVGTSKKDIG